MNNEIQYKMKIAVNNWDYFSEQLNTAFERLDSMVLTMSGYVGIRYRYDYAQQSLIIRTYDSKFEDYTKGSLIEFDSKAVQSDITRFAANLPGDFDSPNWTRSMKCNTLYGKELAEAVSFSQYYHLLPNHYDFQLVMCDLTNRFYCQNDGKCQVRSCNRQAEFETESKMYRADGQRYAEESRLVCSNHLEEIHRSETVSYTHLTLPTTPYV